MNEIQYCYCHNCGTKLLKGTKFCGECGTSLASLSAQPPLATQPQSIPRPRIVTSFRPRIIGNRDADDDNEIVQDKIESIDQLGLTFAADQFGLEEPPLQSPPQRGEKIGDILIKDGSIAPSPLRPRDILGSLETDPKVIKEAFKQEAGGYATETLHGIVKPQSTIHSNRRD